MANSIEDIADFLQRHYDLLRKITEASPGAVDKIRGFADKIDATREEAKAFVTEAGKVEFLVAGSDEMEAKQKFLFEKIETIGKEIQENQNFPEIAIFLYAQRSDMFKELAKTYDDLVAKIVEFTPQDIEELKGLLQRAALNAAERKKQQLVIMAAVDVAKFTVRLAAKVFA
ncbi:MAG TPA: hypothetical protein VJ692_08455 [Nitrospiraceae bacterium]|nr:hypothetical protein [Nitrospiraceae bacterium]